MMDKEVAPLKKERNVSLAADMFLSFIITFAAGVLCYEDYMPEKFIGIYRAAVMVVCLATWFGISFFCGKKKKWQYELFAALFWLIPPLIVFLANDGPEFCRMSITMYLLAEFTEFISAAPAGLAGSIAGLGVLPSIMIILLLCVFSFMAGILTSQNDTEKQK